MLEPAVLEPVLPEPVEPDDDEEDDVVVVDADEPESDAALALPPLPPPPPPPQPPNSAAIPSAINKFTFLFIFSRSRPVEKIGAQCIDSQRDNVCLGSATSLIEDAKTDLGPRLSARLLTDTPPAPPLPVQGDVRTCANTRGRSRARQTARNAEGSPLRLAQRRRHPRNPRRTHPSRRSTSLRTQPTARVSRQRAHRGSPRRTLSAAAHEGTSAQTPEGQG